MASHDKRKVRSKNLRCEDSDIRDFDEEVSSSPRRSTPARYDADINFMLDNVATAQIRPQNAALSPQRGDAAAFAGFRRGRGDTRRHAWGYTSTFAFQQYQYAIFLGDQTVSLLSLMTRSAAQMIFI